MQANSPNTNISFPPSLQPGDLLKVVSPSGGLKELDRLQSGMKIWRDRGYRLEYSQHWDTRYSYLAGTDAQRRQSLAEAWFDPECKGILCARGGYGSMRLLEHWHWKQARGKRQEATKWLIGFSDITGLLWSLIRAKMGGGVHAPVLTTLATEPEWSIQRLFDLVEGRPLAAIAGQGWGGGKTTGILLPANLTVATHLLGTDLQPPLENIILALEDVTEAPYRLDRQLTQWRLLGAFKGVVGIALGRFSQCEGNPGDWTVEEMLRDRLSDLQIPIVSDLPFGHDGVNAALPVGIMAELDGDRGVLAINP
ncbi:S66 peptidase family protein [Spirulina sp. 06S082]|uniref:S66 peptidase family protein n=1 Tax=Spirulina sp. 06S082 TaxID=3110248 RepID=UPI003A4DCFD2